MRDLSERKYTVYKHVTPDGKAYVGMTCQRLCDRWGHGGGYLKNQAFAEAIKHYGWEQIQHVVISSDLSLDAAVKLEQETIRLLDATNPEKGYNVSIGGLGGTLGVKFGPETLKRMSEARKGEKNHNFGKEISKEQSLKLSALRKGKWSEKQKAVLQTVWVKNSIKVVCLDNHMVFDSLVQASKYAGVDSKGIHNACKGEYFKAGGYHWSFYTGQDEEWMTNKLAEIEEQEKVVRARQGKAWTRDPKPVICVETGEIFPSSSKAAEHYEVKRKALHKAVRNSKRTSAGYHWAYYTGQENDRYSQ